MAKVNYKAIKAKVVDVLDDQVDEDLLLEDVKTVHYGPLLATPTNCPMVSVYGGQILPGAQRIGGTKPRDQVVTFKVECVYFSMKDWSDSDDGLSDLLDSVLEVLLGETMLTALQALGAIYVEVGDIDLDEYRDNGFFSGATITFKVEVRR